AGGVAGDGGVGERGRPPIGREHAAAVIRRVVVADGRVTVDGQRVVEVGDAGAFTSASADFGTSVTPGTLPGPWSSASRRASRTATSCAEAIRSAGFLACSLEISAQSHSGTSGMISRIGRGVSSTTRLSTAIVFAARNGGRPLHIV